jgi:hypothetical protein
MAKYKSGFIGDFKLGDNINHNLNILRVLYAFQISGTSSQAELLRKPIIVTIGSIAEAILYDLYMVKIKKFTQEGVPTFSTDLLDELRAMTIDEFAKYISNARSMRILGQGDDLYDSLDELRKLRNRVHIQNSKRHFEADDADAFNSTRQLQAEATLEALIHYMSTNHLRLDSRQHVQDFELPWESRLPSI